MPTAADPALMRGARGEHERKCPAGLVPDGTAVFAIRAAVYVLERQSEHGGGGPARPGRAREPPGRTRVTAASVVVAAARRQAP